MRQSKDGEEGDKLVKKTVVRAPAEVEVSTLSLLACGEKEDLLYRAGDAAAEVSTV